MIEKTSERTSDEAIYAILATQGERLRSTPLTTRQPIANTMKNKQRIRERQPIHEYLVESLEGKHNPHNKQLPKLGDYYKYSKSSRLFVCEMAPSLGKD